MYVYPRHGMSLIANHSPLIPTSPSPPLIDEKQLVHVLELALRNVPYCFSTHVTLHHLASQKPRLLGNTIHVGQRWGSIPLHLLFFPTLNMFTSMANPLSQLVLINMLFSCKRIYIYLHVYTGSQLIRGTSY